MIKTSDLLKYIEEGASLGKDLKPINYNDGFMVSILGEEKTYKETQIEDIKEDIKGRQKRLKKGQFIGIWKNQDNNMIYVDISQRYEHKKNAIQVGIKNHQYSIFDLKTHDEIKLIKKTYILYQYNKIKNDINYIHEFMSLDELKTYILQYIDNTITTRRDTLKHYILKSIDDEIKNLLNDKYLIIEDGVYYRDLIEE